MKDRAKSTVLTREGRGGGWVIAEVIIAVNVKPGIVIFLDIPFKHAP